MRRILMAGAAMLAALLIGVAPASANCPPGVGLPEYCTIGYENVVLQDNPLAYWRLGDALDTSSMSDATGHYPGEYKNGAGGSPQTGISGDGDTAAYFVGNGQYGYVPSIPAPTHAYSMEAWVLPSDAGAAMIMQHGGGGALYITSQGHYAFVPDSNEVHLQVVDPGDAVPGGGASAFHHIVGTWDGSTARLYVDGRLVATATASQAPSGASSFYIGYGTLAPWFRGYIDEAAYYDHALSAARISAHFYADPPPALLTPRGTPSAPPASAVGQPSHGQSSQSPPAAGSDGAGAVRQCRRLHGRRARQRCIRSHRHGRHRGRGRHHH